MKRLHAAAGIAGAILFLKIMTLNMVENLFHQWLGAEYGGITIETVSWGIVFALILWYIVKKG